MCDAAVTAVALWRESVRPPRRRRPLPRSRSPALPDICICGRRMLNSCVLSARRSTHGLLCESGLVAGLIHNDKPSPGQTEQMPSRHTPRSQPLQHKTAPLAIQVSSCVLGEGIFKRGNWHSTTKMHYGNAERMDKHVTDLTRIWRRQHQLENSSFLCLVTTQGQKTTLMFPIGGAISLSHHTLDKTPKNAVMDSL